MTNYESPRLAKMLAWNAGAEASMEFVNKAVQEIMKACEEAEIAGAPSPDWIALGRRFARLGEYLCNDGLATVRDHNPFVLREFTDADTRRLLKVVGGPPPKTKTD